jgi:hypothetical protein
VLGSAPRSGIAALIGLWLVARAGAAAGAEPDVPTDGFVDRAGDVRAPGEVYLRHLERSEPAHLLTIGEELLFLGAGTAWYWLDREHNLADWDYPSWEQRLNLEAWRYDNNSFPMNFLAHTLNGAAFYAIPRANGHGVGTSAAYALATSFAWEFLIEFREKVSINDMIVTQGAGMAVGEFAAKLFHYVNGLPARPSGTQRAVAATLGLPVWLKRRVHGEAAVVDGPYDELGFADAIGHRLGVGLESRFHDWGSGAASTHGPWLRGRLSTIPGEGRPGRYDFFFHEADVATLSVFGGFGDRSRELDLYADVLLLGLYTQSLDTRRRGPAATLGLAMAHRYRFRDFVGYNDRLGIVHLPGPAADLVVRFGGGELTTSWRLSADFAGVHSAAYGRWKDAELAPGDRPKSILRKHNYYYGWGGSSRVGAALVLPPFDAFAGVTIGAYDSHEGLDRAQEEITRDPDATDRWLELDSGAGVTIPATPVRLGVGFGVNRRDSHVERFFAERVLRTWSANLGVVL